MHDPPPAMLRAMNKRSSLHRAGLAVRPGMALFCRLGKRVIVLPLAGEQAYKAGADQADKASGCAAF